MRTRDDEKRDALFKATVKLVNDIGFAASSVSKIAREARISPATIYIYYKNKEDLLVSTYIDIKRHMSRAILENFNDNLPIRDIFRQVWGNMFEFVAEYPEHIQFAEQFANSPYQSLVDPEAVEKYFEPIFIVLQRGIEQKILKNVDYNLLTAFMFHPILTLCNTRICREFELTRDNIDMAFSLAWDAIKL